MSEVLLKWRQLLSLGTFLDFVKSHISMSELTLNHLSTHWQGLPRGDIRFNICTENWPSINKTFKCLLKCYIDTRVVTIWLYTRVVLKVDFSLVHLYICAQSPTMSPRPQRVLCNTTTWLRVPTLSRSILQFSSVVNKIPFRTPHALRHLGKQMVEWLAVA